MKISSKLFIGLLSTIFMVIMAILIDIRVFGINRNEMFANSHKEDFPIGDFAHLRIDNLSNFYLDPLADKSYIQFESFSDSVKSFIDYKVSHDTLIIYGNDQNAFFKYTLFCHEHIRSITLNNASIRITGIEQDSINFNIKEGQVNSYWNDERKDSHFKTAKFNLLDSKINLSGITVDTLALDMQKSNARIETDVYKIHASLKSNSELNLRKVANLDIDKDESSTLRIY